MSNMQKAFKIKAKRGLCMAQGGFLSTVPDAMPTSMFAGPGGGVATSFSGSSAPMLPNQRGSDFSSGGGLRQALPQATQPSSAVQGIDNKIAMNNAIGGLSNTERYQLENPGNKPYSAAGVAPGSSAEASQLGQQTSILGSLRKSLSQQQPVAMAEGGILPVVNTLRGRAAQIEAAVNGPQPVAQAPAQPDPNAVDSAGLTVAEREAARSKIEAMKPKKTGLMSRLGFEHGGIVRGKGGVDNVPMNLNGVDVNLTGGETPEAVLPSKTVQALGGPEAVEELIERTNGKPPVKTGLRAGGRYADGVIQDGVRTGVRKGGRTNWINPETQVVPYEQPVIESTATRVPNNPPEFIRQDAQPRSLNQNSPLYESLRAQPKPAPAPGTSVVPASPVNSSMNERVGNTGAAPQPEPYKPNWVPGSKGGSVVRYSQPVDMAADAGAAARSANEVHQASVIKEAMRKNNLHPVMAAAEKAGEYLGPKVANTLRGAQNFARAAGPALEAAVPAMAAYDAQFGDDAIVVNDWRGAAHSTGEKLKGGLKEAALRTGDWGTKGLDALASPFTAVTNVGAKLMGSEERVPYTKYNDIYRKGMQSLDNVNAPTNGQATSGTRIVTDPTEIARLKAMSTRHGAGSKPAGSTNLLDTPQYNSSSPEAVAAAKSAQLDPNFTPDANQTRTLRSGYMSNMADDPNVVRGTSTVDATEMKAPEGGGYITGQPGAGGLRRSIAVQPSATKWEDGPQYKAAIAKNERDKVTLRDMQRERIKRTAAMPGATQGDMVALADQEKDDALQNDKLKLQNEMQFKREDLGLRRAQNAITLGNMQRDNERADRTQQDLEAEKVSNHLDKLLDNYVPTTGLKDEELSAAQTKRARIQQAMMETYGGEPPKNLQEFQKDAVKRLHQARLTEALNAAMMGRGPIDKFRNVMGGFVNPTIGMDPARSIKDTGDYTIEHAGVPLFKKDVFQGDNDLISAFKERLKKQNDLKSSK